MGQPLAYKSQGKYHIKIWHGDIYSDQNSQQLVDWYSFTHITHGVFFYFLLWLIKKIIKFKQKSLLLLLLIALILEMAWEIFENTDFVINRYRESTISLGYYGDSVINSVFDVLFMVVGFLIAAFMPVWFTILFIIVLELFLLYMIRDNLILNLIMLIFPSQAILQWQMQK
ncbi:MAG: UPF0314 protein [Candidatus Parcubacteria bacterium]|nr:MAG: UPF0314 protein [Candidatus Parcubacteria bacterium]